MHKPPPPLLPIFHPPLICHIIFMMNLCRMKITICPPPPAQETQNPQIPFTRSRAKLMKKIAPIFSLPLSERVQHARTSGKMRLVLSLEKQRSLVETCNNVAAQIMQIQQKKNSPPLLIPLSIINAQTFIRVIVLVYHTPPSMARKILSL